jgi:hypothetical protein
MELKNKNLLSVLILIVFFVIGVASSPKNMVYRDFEKWMPVTFNPNTTILLVEKHPIDNKQNDRMKTFLEKKYPYRYEIVDIGSILNPSGKYADRSLYKFAVTWKIESSRDAISKSNGADLIGQFVDLTTNEKSKSTNAGNGFGQLGYMPFFNSIVKKFK